VWARVFLPKNMTYGGGIQGLRTASKAGTLANLISQVFPAETPVDQNETTCTFVTGTHPSKNPNFFLALQLVALHFRYTVLHTNTIASKLYNLRCKFRYSNAHPQHTIENRIVKAHSTLKLDESIHGVTVVIPTNDREIPGSTP